MTQGELSPVYAICSTVAYPKSPTGLSNADHSTNTQNRTTSDAENAP
ncbi:hypothetical protein PS040_25565 (plasmid) [Escherichia albertii]|nr:hypothetical protein [Escherichia albertii]WDB76795.1 hypothetical protein PS034_24035 [Escherichia albertii]WDC14044.1 hypothetical protein PS040_25565 [Escherichia albertii]